MPGTKNHSRSKIKGAKLAEFEGLAIYGAVAMPKRRGKKRVLIQIRAAKSDDLRIAQNLSYTQSVKVLFETETSRNSLGQVL